MIRFKETAVEGKARVNNNVHIFMWLHPLYMFKLETNTRG